MNVRKIVLLGAVVGFFSAVQVTDVDVHAASMPKPGPNFKRVTSTHGYTLTIDPERFHVYDIPADKFESITGLPREVQTPELPVGRAAAAPQAEVGRVLAVLVEWENHPALFYIHTRTTYDEMFFSQGTYPTGSINDYYQEVSYGDFSLDGEVVGWRLMRSYYEGWYDIGEIIEDIDPLVNFADYDGDGDGYVDALWIIHAGPGQEETHNPYDIWSHAVRGAYVPTNDGVAVERWSVQPEELANEDIIPIRVFCHEYAHILGLPDLYDYDDKTVTETYYTPNDYNDHPVNDWCVMGYAGYALMSYGTGTCPSHFCAWSRSLLGWATPQLLADADTTVDLYNVELHNTQNILKVPLNAAGTEYYLLEYRNPHTSAKFDHLDSDFSAYFHWFTPGQDTLDCGLLILQVDDEVGPNDGTPSEPHYAVRVIDAGYNPDNPWDGASEYSDWWYPYEFQISALFSTEDPGQTVLSPTTTPSSDSYTGPSGITLTVLAQNADYLTLRLQMPDTDDDTVLDLYDNCPTVANPGQEDDDLDGIGNACECDCGAVWGDVDINGNIDPIDVAYMVKYVYKMQDARVQPANCPYEAGDANCDDAVNPLDVAFYVNYVYKDLTPFPCSGGCQ